VRSESLRMTMTTFSIVAADRTTGEIGIAVQSKFLAVGAVVPFVRAGVGAIATQAFANTSYGPQALEMLARGVPPEAVARALTEGDGGREDRQFGIVAAAGAAASFTGSRCISWAGGITGDDFAAQGNCLAGAAVVRALADTFRATGGALADRLVACLRGAQAQGGDKRGQQSATLLIEKPHGGYGGFNDRYVDLRVDDHPTPIEELARLLELHKLYFFAPEERDVLEIDAPQSDEIVSELVRVGALPTGHERYDAAARAALVAYMHVENLENRVRDDGRIDRQTLEYLRTAPAPSPRVVDQAAEDAFESSR
jgi:uncharacterized Ntn-hydrolase superfamily protein